MIKRILLLIISIVFVASAVAKLISIEYFQQFIYSLGWLTFKQVIVFARLMIAVELGIALLLILQIYQKAVIGFAVSLLMLFSLFIVYLEFFTAYEDCHCFGNVFQLSNKESLAKNMVLIIGLIYLYLANEKGRQWIKVRKSFLLIGAVIVSLVSGFSVNFPVSLFGQTKEATFCRPCLEQFVTAGKMKEKKMLICFLSTKCKYCKLAAQRVTVMTAKENQKNDILYVLWDDYHNPRRFYTETQSYPFKSAEMDVLKFLDLTQGIMPLIVLYDHGKVVHSYRYADLDEEVVVDFLKKRE